MANKTDMMKDLLAQLARLSADDLKKVNSQASALKRDKKAKAEKAALAMTFGPLFDAMDAAIKANPRLREILEKRDSMRVHFDEGIVNRDNYYNYGSRSGNAGGNGTKVWYRKDEKVYQFSSGRAMCDWLEIPNTGASFRADCKKHKITFLEVKPEGDVVIIE